MYIVSKLFTFLLLPPGIFIILLLLAAIFSRKFKLTLFISAIIFYLLSTKMGANFLLEPLESISSKGVKNINAVVILGGGSNSNAIYKAYDDAFKREVYAIKLAKQTSLPLIFSGGGLEKNEAKNFLSDYKKIFNDYNLTIYLEPNSLNTAQNAKFTSKLFSDKNLTKNIYLVTSAYHMKRAQDLFEKEGFKVEPKPIGFLAEVENDSFWELFPRMRYLGNSYKALHEYCGILLNKAKKLYLTIEKKYL